MAMKVGGSTALVRRKKTTSIGKSVLSYPKNKSKRRNWKKYRGQGK